MAVWCRRSISCSFNARAMPRLGSSLSRWPGSRSTCSSRRRAIWPPAPCSGRKSAASINVDRLGRLPDLLRSNLAGTARVIGTFLSHLTLDSSPTRSVGRALMEPLEGCDDSAWRRCHGLAFYSYQQPGRPRMYWRDGSLPGVTAFAAVTEDGDVFVLLGNARDPRNWISIHDELGLLVYDHL